MSRVEKNKNLNKNKDLNGSSLKVSIVVSQWNSQITESLYEAAFLKLKKLGVQSLNISRINVSGSFELIFGCKLAIKDKPDSVIAIGSLIKGETKHFDFVCQGATNGIMSLGLRYNKPVIFCVLTDENEKQSLDRSGGKHGNKGVECAISCLKMIELKRRISSSEKKIGF